MRPILVGLLCVFFLGTVWSYARLSSWLTPTQPDYQFEVATGDYSIQITTNYDLASSGENQLIARLNGEEVYGSPEGVVAGVPVTIRGLPVRAGENHLFVEVPASQQDAQKQIDRAAAFLLSDEKNDSSASKTEKNPKSNSQKKVFRFVRVQIFRDGIPVFGGDLTTHLDSRDVAISEIFFFAFKTDKIPTDH